MKYTIYVLAAIALIAACTLGARHTEALFISTPSAQAATSTPEIPQLTDREAIWLDALEWQESRGNTAAINPKDSDGTPSYGCLQFKPGTFDRFSQLYGIATTSIMSCPEQRAIVTQMIITHVNLKQQFPASVRLLGLPPYPQNR